MEIINPEALGAPVGYSNGVKATGSFLAIAGQVGWDREGRIVAGDFTAQFARALGNVVEVVHAAGGGPDRITALTIFVTDRHEYLDSRKALGKEYRRGRHYPAMTLVEVKGLIEEGARVEIQGWAVL